MDQDSYKLEKKVYYKREKKPGPKSKYKTEGERIEASRESKKRYYERNKDKYTKTKKDISEENNQMILIYKKYKEGRLVEKEI